MTYSKMTQKEWEAAVQTAKTRFVVEELGARPTKRTVAKTLHNEHEISILEWLGFVLLIFVGIVTAYKMTSIAIPFAYSFFPTAPSWVTNSFAFFMAITFVLFSTSGIIYYKLMDEYSDEIQSQKRKYKELEFAGGWQGAVGGAAIVAAMAAWVMGYSIEVTSGIALVSFAVLLYLGGMPTNLLQYASPRLYLWLTYFTVVWLFMVSSEGDGSFFAKYGVVLAEVALAYLVAEIIRKNDKWRKLVHKAWQEATEPYDKRLENFWEDRDYLRILYRELREALANIERPHPEKKNQRVKPNLRLIMQGSADEIDGIILSEYQRMTGGLRFADMVNSVDVVTPSPIQAQVSAKRRIPPVGDKTWKPDRLQQDFVIRGLQPSDDYTEKNLTEDYEDGYQARSAFRDGAREYFTKYKAEAK